MSGGGWAGGCWCAEGLPIGLYLQSNQPTNQSNNQVRHWMWPLFTERWSGFRQERLGLPPVPLLMQQEQQQEEEGVDQLPPAVPLLYGEGRPPDRGAFLHWLSPYPTLPT